MGKLHVQPVPIGDNATLNAPTLHLSLPGSPVTALLTIDASSGVPVALRMTTHTGGPREWRWPSWPVHAEHIQSTGQREEYIARQHRGDHEQSGSDIPAVTEMPAGISSDPSPSATLSPAVMPVEVDISRCEGGKFLLRGVLGLDGPPGWFILDPGCDTSAVTAAAADAAGFSSFGQQVRLRLGAGVCTKLRLMSAECSKQGISNEQCICYIG